MRPIAAFPRTKDILKAGHGLCYPWYLQESAKDAPSSDNHEIKTSINELGAPSGTEPEASVLSTNRSDNDSSVSLYQVD
jgi:hypothetical protein